MTRASLAPEGLVLLRARREVPARRSPSQRVLSLDFGRGYRNIREQKVNVLELLTGSFDDHLNYGFTATD